MWGWLLGLLARLRALLSRIFAPLNQLLGQSLDEGVERRLPPHSRPRSGYDERDLSKVGLTEREKIFHTSRQHLVVLVLPLARTVSGVAVLLAPGVSVFVPLAFAFAVYKAVPRRQGWQRRIIAAGIATALLAVGSRDGSFGMFCVPVLALWLFYDVGKWFHEVLVVTNKRVLLIHGIFAMHRPSVSLQAVVFTNCISDPVGDLFNYGTIDLDTASQRDGALANLEYVPHAYDVWRLILQLRSEHRRELGPGGATE